MLDLIRTTFRLDLNEKFEPMFDGVSLMGANLIDLIDWSTSSRNMTDNAPSLLQLFMRTLTTKNVAAHVFVNKTRRSFYQSFISQQIEVGLDEDPGEDERDTTFVTTPTTRRGPRYSFQSPSSPAVTALRNRTRRGRELAGDGNCKWNFY